MSDGRVFEWGGERSETKCDRFRDELQGVKARDLLVLHCKLMNRACMIHG